MMWACLATTEPGNLALSSGPGSEVESAECFPYLTAESVFVFLLNADGNIGLQFPPLTTW